MAPGGRMPAVVIHHRQLDWLVLVEAGAVTAKRREELAKLFQGARAGRVYVSAFPTRPAMAKRFADIAWETEVWVAEEPAHVIHMNGERLLGPVESC